MCVYSSQGAEDRRSVASRGGGDVRLESAGATEAGAFRSPSRQDRSMSKMDDSNESILMIDAQGGGGGGREGARRGNAGQRGKKKKKKKGDATKKPHELTEKEQLCLSHAGENETPQHIGMLSRFANIYMYICMHIVYTIMRTICIGTAIYEILVQLTFSSTKRCYPVRAMIALLGIEFPSRRSKVNSRP